MNCPFHVLVYKDELRSYRELPLRWAELGTVYRYERSGTLHGLFRVRGFTQDDAHIFCLPEQLADEITDVLSLMETVLTKFGFSEYEVMLSTRPEKSVGGDEIWDKATGALKEALSNKNWDYSVDEGGGTHARTHRLTHPIHSPHPTTQPLTTPLPLTHTRTQAPSMAQRSTSRLRTPSAGCGSVLLYNATSTYRIGLGWSMSPHRGRGSSRLWSIAPSSARLSASLAC